MRQVPVADVIRKFADLVERRRDEIRVADPGWANLMTIINAMAAYARSIGGDLGVGKFPVGPGLVVPEKLKLPDEIKMPKATDPRRTMGGL